ncbi:MAG: mechanosensitive ion channel [Steroidobacteraceae bacterium]
MAEPGILDRLLEPAVITEVAAMLLAVTVAWVAIRLVERWYASRPDPHHGLPALAREAAAVAVPYLVALTLVWGGRQLFRAFDVETMFLTRAIPLLAALVAIRLGVFLLSVSLGKDRRLRVLENRTTLIVWFFVALHLLGWLEALIATLDAVGFTAGGARITLWSVFKSLFTVTLFVIVSIWVARWIEQRVRNLEPLAPATRIGIAKFIQAVLIGFGVLLGLRASGVDLTALTVFSGAIGIGLGFGLQSIAANFVSGFVLLMDKSIKPGDVISFTGTPGTSTEGFGWVQELRGRYVVVRDRDGVETLVPNQHVITNMVINWSHTDPKVRLKLPIRISYRDDPEVALAVLLRAAENHPRILVDPKPVSRLMRFGEYAMELELRFWIIDPQEGVNNVRSDVNRRIWKLFREHGITIPVPQQQVRLLDDGDTRGAAGVPPSSPAGDV